MSLANSAGPAIPGDSPTTLDQLEQFDAAWRQGNVPRIEAFLPPAGAPARRQLLEELVKIDLEYRWRRARQPSAGSAGALLPGDTHRGPRLEDYVARFPDLGPLESLPEELVGEEYRVRRRWGDDPKPVEYAARFAWLGATLRQHLADIDAELAAEPAGMAPAIAGGGAGPAQTWGPTLVDADEGSLGLALVPVRGKGTPSAVPRSLLPGYEILEEVSRGGMGVVYKARQKSLNRLVALKMIRSGELAGTEELARFRREAELVAQLHHPHVVQIYEVGEDQGQPFFAMEFISGGSLDQKLQRMPQPPREAAQLIEVLARTMQAAHQRGIIHRDLKPANVLMQSADCRLPIACADTQSTICDLPSAIPKITDFGLAKRLDATVSPTQSGAVLGTPSYMAPEQAEGRINEVAAAVDIYALGAILYETLTGRPPFLADTPLETLVQVRSQEPVPPRRLQPKVPRDLETICLRCLEKEPRKRYASAAALAEDLQRFLLDTPIRARPIRSWERALKWAWRRPAAAALLAVSTLAVIVLAALVLGYNARLGRTNRDLAQALQQAEDNFHLALQAVDEYSIRVSKDDRLRAHDLEKLRRDLLKSAAEFYQKFVEQRPDDPSVRTAQGLAYLQLASLNWEMGKQAEAFDCNRNAIAIFEQLKDDHPNNPEYLTNLAGSLNNLGAKYWQTYDSAQAEDAYRQALDMRRQLVHGYPEEPKHRTKLADSLNNLGVLYQESGRAVLAEDAHREAKELWQQLAHEQADVLDHQLRLGGSSFNLGIVFEGTGRRKEAEAAYVVARGIQEKLAHDQPGNPEYRTELAGTLTNLGSVYQATRRPKLAVQVYRDGGDLWEALVAEHPTVPGYQDSQASIHFSLGVVYEDDFGQAKEAEVAYRRAYAIGDNLLRNYPERPDYRVGLARTLQALGHLCCEIDRPGPARESLNGAEMIRKKLVDDCPTELDFPAGLGATYASLGLLDSRTGKPQAALDRYLQSIRLLESTLEKQPQHTLARSSLSATYQWRATTLTDLGRHAEALRDCDQAVQWADDIDRDQARLHRAVILARQGKHEPAVAEADVVAGQKDLPGRVLYHLARVYALASGAARTEARLTSAERTQRSEQHACHAVALLTQARSWGYFVEPTRIDAKDLEPLLARADYQDLMRAWIGKK